MKICMKVIYKIISGEKITNHKARIYLNECNKNKIINLLLEKRQKRSAILVQTLQSFSKGFMIIAGIF